MGRGKNSAIVFVGALVKQYSNTGNWKVRNIASCERTAMPNLGYLRADPLPQPLPDFIDFFKANGVWHGVFAPIHAIAF